MYINKLFSDAILHTITEVMNMNSVEMYQQDGNKYIYDAMRGHLYTICPDGRFKTSREVEKDEFNGNISFSKKTSCFGKIDIEMITLQNGAYQVYDEQSRAFKTHSGNWYKIDAVNGVVTGKGIPNQSSPFRSARINEAGRLEIVLAGENAGKVLTTSKVEHSVSLTEFEAKPFLEPREHSRY